MKQLLVYIRDNKLKMTLKIQLTLTLQVAMIKE